MTLLSRRPQAVVPTEDGPVLVPADQVLHPRSDGPPRVLALAGSAAGAAAHAASGAGTTAGRALATALEKAGPVAGDALSTVRSTVRDAAGGAAGSAWERARSSSAAQGLAARSDLVAGLVGRRRRRRWPLLAGLAVGLSAGVAVARRRSAASARAAVVRAPATTGDVGAPSPVGDTTGPPRATGEPVAPGHPPTTCSVGGSDAERPLGQVLSGGVDPVSDGGAGAAGGPALGSSDGTVATGPERMVTELPAATSATPDGELHTEP